MLDVAIIIMLMNYTEGLRDLCSLWLTKDKLSTVGFNMYSLSSGTDHVDRSSSFRCCLSIQRVQSKSAVPVHILEDLPSLTHSRFLLNRPVSRVCLGCWDHIPLFEFSILAGLSFRIYQMSGRQHECVTFMSSESKWGIHPTCDGRQRAQGLGI